MRFLLIVMFPFFASAQLKVAKVFSNNMVLQRDKPFSGFSRDGINDCESYIQKNTVVIAAREKPSFVFYGWKSYTDANLVNSEKLPASTFKLIVK